MHKLPKISPYRPVSIGLLALFFGGATVLISMPAAARGALRDSTRWTLSDWLAQKERNKMMDLWLTMNTPSPFEFTLSGSFNSYKTSRPSSKTQDWTTYSGEATAYAKLVGLTVEYEKRPDESTNDLSGMLNLRLLGNSTQSTSLILHVGQRSRSIESHVIRNEFGQASLQLYVTQFFGIDGFYRHYLSAKDSSFGDISGTRAGAGIYIDFGPIRLWGAWFKDTQLNSQSEGIHSEGIRSGLKLFF